jgi:hypothetical protein
VDVKKSKCPTFRDGGSSFVLFSTDLNVELTAWSYIAGGQVGKPPMHYLPGLHRLRGYHVLIRWSFLWWPHVY